MPPPYSIVIPYQPGDPTRDAVYQWLVAYYHALLPEAEIVVTPEVLGSVNRSRLRNRAVAQATTARLVIMDADCLVDAETVRTLVGLLDERVLALWQCQGVRYVTQASTAQVLQQTTVNPMALSTDRFVPVVRGHLFALTRQTWQSLGGFDERFTGWGGEDMGVAYTAQGLGIPHRRIAQCTFHLWHHPAPDKCYDRSTNEDNRALFQQYEAVRTDLRAAHAMRAASLAHRGALRIAVYRTASLPELTGGAEWSCLEMACALQRDGHMVEMLTPQSPVQSFHGIVRATHDIDEQYDAIVGDHDGSLHAAERGRALKVPTWVYLHNARPYSVRVAAQCKQLGAFVYNNARHTCAAVHADGVIYPTVHHDRYRVAEPGDRITLMNLSAEKGSSTLWALARALPDHQFLAVKGGYGEQVIPDVVPPNVEVMDLQDDARIVYARTRVLLLPSHDESWGRVVLEAGCSGIPVIASTAVGPREMMGDAIPHLHTDDVDAWVAALRALDDPAAYAEASDAIRARTAAVDTMTRNALDAFVGELVMQARSVAPAGGRVATTATSTGRVSFLASESHHADHLVPLYLAHPTDRRGPFYLTPTGSRIDERAQATLRQAGITPTVCASTDDLQRCLRANKAAGPVVVSAARNAREVLGSGRPVVLMQHGAGQSYNVRNASYAGGTERGGVVLELCVNESVAEQNRLTHPEIPNAVVGSPRLDALATIPRPLHTRPVVCISTHWECRMVPETRSAFTYYREALGSLLGQEFDLIGHAHPRAAAQVRPVFAALGIQFVGDFAEVVQRADVYVCDNSSTIFEMAALNRPVVLLNAPWYRKEVQHGLRFWAMADIGVQCDRPSDLLTCIRTALADRQDQRDRRHRLSRAIYPWQGQSAQRAVDAIRETAACWQPLAKAIGESEGSVVLMQANYGFCYAGVLMERGQLFRAQDRDVRRLEGTVYPGRSKPCAQRVAEVSEPEVVEAPAAESGVVWTRYCKKCNTTFTDCAEYMRHIRTHGKVSEVAPLDNGEPVTPLGG